MTMRYHAGAELAAGQGWLSSNGALVDLTGLDLTLIVSRHGQALLTKTGGLTGAAGEGSEPSGTPNLTIEWAANELDLPAGIYSCRIEARNAQSLDHVWVVDLIIPTSTPT